MAGGRARALAGGGGRYPAESDMSGERVSTAGESGSMGDSNSDAKFDS